MQNFIEWPKDLDIKWKFKLNCFFQNTLINKTLQLKQPKWGHLTIFFPLEDTLLKCCINDPKWGIVNFATSQNTRTVQSQWQRWSWKIMGCALYQGLVCTYGAVGRSENLAGGQVVMWWAPFGLYRVNWSTKIWKGGNYDPPGFDSPAML